MGCSEGDHSQTIFGQERAPRRGRGQAQDALLDFRMELQQVQEVRQADAADAQFPRERGLAQARGAIEPLAAFQGPPQAYLNSGRTRLLPSRAAARFQLLAEQDFLLPFPGCCDSEGKLIK